MLRDIGQAIGPVLRIDAHTATESRGRFARICVQINFDKSLIKLIKIGGIKQTVQCEGLNSLCFSCGRVGHKLESCPYTTRSSVKEDEREREVESDNSNTNGQMASHEQTYGPWVVVARRKKGYRKEKKEQAHPPLFSINSQFKARGPVLVDSPLTIRPSSSDPVDKDESSTLKLFSNASAFVADRTSQSKEKDKRDLSTKQLRSKNKPRDHRPNLKSHGTQGLKEQRQVITTEGNDPTIRQEFQFQLATPIVFSAGGCASASSNQADDARVPIRESIVQGESIGVSELNPTGTLSATIRDKAEYIEKMEDIVASAFLKVSKAILKRIDPKLRPPKKVSERIPSMEKGSRRDSIMQEAGTEANFHTTAEVDIEGMQMEEGGESLDSVQSVL